MFTDYDNTEANKYGIGSYFYICIMTINKRVRDNIIKICDSFLDIVDFNIEQREDSIDIMFQDSDKLEYTLTIINNYLGKIESLEKCLKLEV